MQMSSVFQNFITAEISESRASLPTSIKIGWK